MREDNEYEQGYEKAYRYKQHARYSSRQAGVRKSMRDSAPGT